MRPLETLLVLANLLGLYCLVRPLPRVWRHAALLAPGLLLAQVGLEGARWMLLPAYVFAGLLGLGWLWQLYPRATKQNRLMAAVGAAAWLISSALPLAFPVFHFPKPSGPYEIGTLTYHWVDQGRPEIFTPDPSDRRELMAQIWYPAAAAPNAPRAGYVTNAEALAAALAEQRQGAGPAWQYLKYVLQSLSFVTTNARSGASMAQKQTSYPVLVLLEGATGFRQANTFQVEELASHGYVVVALDQPYTAALVSFPDGRQALGLPFATQLRALIRQSYSPTQTAPVLNGRALPDGIIAYLERDLHFALERLHALNKADPNGILTGRLDFTRLGVFGISLGGIVAAEACRLESELRACLMMDAPMPTDVLNSGLARPSLWLTRDAQTMRLERQRSGGWSEADITEHQTSMRSVFHSLRAEGYFVQIPGIFHVDFTDVPNWSPLLSLLGISGPIGGQRAHQIINAYSLAFFNHFLKGQVSDLLERPPEDYSGVSLETHRP